MALLDWELRLHPPNLTPYIEVEPSSYASWNMYAYLDSLSITVNAMGGCQSASFALLSESDDYLWGEGGGATTYQNVSAGTTPVTLWVQGSGDSALVKRFHGVIIQADAYPSGTPKRRAFKVRGVMDFLQKRHLLYAADDVTPNDLFKAIVYAGRSISGGAESWLNTRYDLITYDPSYTIPEVDFLDPGANVARGLKLAATVAGADAVYGVTATTATADVSQNHGQAYLKQTTETPVEQTFEQGVDCEVTGHVIDVTNMINCAIITCQKQLAGGDLTLRLEPDSTPTGTPWLYTHIQVPEVFDPALAYEYATNILDTLDDPQRKVSIRVPGFCDQLWANDIINAPISVKLRKGASATTLHVDSYTLKLDSDGSCETTLKVGPAPEVSLMSVYGDMMRNVVVANIGNFWSSAELAARDSDVLRDWRRGVARDHGIGNFWAAALHDMESVVPVDDVLETEPSGWPSWDWQHNTEDQKIEPAGSGNGAAESIFIPTGRYAAKAIVLVDNVGFAVRGRSDHWQKKEWESACFIGYDATHGLSASGITDPTFDAIAYTDYLFSDELDESPLTMRVHQFTDSSDSTVPTSWADMAALTSYIDVFWALEGTTQGAAKYYGVRLFQPSGSSTIYAAAGWYEGGTGFVNTHWTSASPPYGSFTEGSSDFMSIVCTMPVDDNDYWSVAIYDGEVGGSALWSFNEQVDIGVSEAHNPSLGDECYLAGMRWVDYHPYFKCSGIRSLSVAGPDDIPCAVTRDGTTWKTGTCNSLLSLTGGTAWSGDEVGVRFAVSMGPRDAVAAWGIGFLTVDEV